MSLEFRQNFSSPLRRKVHRTKLVNTTGKTSFSLRYSPETVPDHNGQDPPATVKLEILPFSRCSKWCRKNRKYWRSFFSTAAAIYSLMLSTDGGAGSSWNIRRASRMVRPSAWNGNSLLYPFTAFSPAGANTASSLL